jgi:hypothetical protein
MRVPTSLARQHVVSLSLVYESEPAWRRAATERCKADPTVTAVRVTPVGVTPTSRDPNALPALRFWSVYRCRDLLAKEPRCGVLSALATQVKRLGAKAEADAETSPAHEPAALGPLVDAFRQIAKVESTAPASCDPPLCVPRNVTLSMKDVMGRRLTISTCPGT